MNEKLGELFIKAIEEWRIKKGIGTAIIPFGVNDKVLMLGILQRVYNNKNFGRTFIITSDFNERSQLVDFLTHQNEEENNKEFKDLISKKTIKVVSKNLVEDNLFTLNGIFSLVILYHVEDITNIICEALNKGKFKLVIVNKLIADEDRSKLYKICPLLETFKEDEVRSIRLSTPVEELLVDVQLNSKDEKTLKQHNDYITTSVNIFGDLKMLDKARIGDKDNNVSAEEVCRRVAISNGWSENLDMNIEYNRQIDFLFNPISLSDRAKLTYDIIRARTELLASNENKLQATYEIVKEHSYKKILIINKKANFATQVRDYLNKSFNKQVCECFHDKLDSIELKDINGNFVTYKSGAKAGMIKMAGAQLQCTMNMSSFNNNRINVLSVGNAPDKKLAIDVDIVIITSPLCNDIESYIYRLDKVNFNSPIKLFTLYISNTLEQRHLQERRLPVSHILLNNIKNIAAYDKINDVIVVD
jgi:hypothetical protein